MYAVPLDWGHYRKTLKKILAEFVQLLPALLTVGS